VLTTPSMAYCKLGTEIGFNIGPILFPYTTSVAMFLPVYEPVQYLNTDIGKHIKLLTTSYRTASSIIHHSNYGSLTRRYLTCNLKFSI